MPRRDLPSENEYSVIGCPECEALQIIKGNPKTTKCDRCRTTLQFRDLRYLYRSESRDAAKKARAMKLAERNNDKEGYMELLQSGELDGEAVRGFTKTEFLEEQGIDPSVTGATDEDEEVPKIPAAIEEAIGELDNPTAQATVQYVTGEYGYDDEEVRDMLDRLRRQGDVIKQSGGVLRYL